MLVAFSGGVDSSFLLKVCAMYLPKEKILAVTASSPTFPEAELGFSKKITRQLGVRHRIIRTGELKNKEFLANPSNRCYFCKHELFARLNKIAGKNKINFVIDASNLSDRSDFRPGNKAKKELRVRSPLEEAGFTKENIRGYSRKLGLPTWDKPSLACLASRIPYGVNITLPILKRIEKGESYLHGLGFRQVRLRHYNGLCRIEVSKGEIARLLSRRSAIIDRLKKFGYNYVTLDLEGYRTGSLNEVNKK